VSVRAPDGDVVARVDATPSAPALHVPGPVPFGRGWIGWTAVPRMRPCGQAVVGGVPLQVARCSVYHDRNWGRWFWGDDAGWRWGAFLGEEPAPAVVVARATRRDGSGGPPVLAVHGRRRTVLRGDSVRVRGVGRYQGDLVRLPGVLAALHSGRSRPHLPARVVVEGRDGVADVRVELTVRAVAQVIAGDPVRRGYTFLHELVGEAVCEGRAGGQDVGFTGLGVYEHVD
jgi:hypothetical protein